MGHRSRSRSRDSIERSRYKKSDHRHSSSYKRRHSSRRRSRTRSRSDSRGREYLREPRHRDKSLLKREREYDSEGSGSENSHLRLKKGSDDVQQEFEVSNFSKAYGLDLSGFVGLSSEILNVTSSSEDKKLSRFERRKFRQHELKHHQDRFWKCKKCDFMNYLSNYECKRCKGLRASCAS